MQPVHASIPAVEQWDVFEIVLTGPSDGNPFIDVELSARFTHDEETIDTRGFYDGEGTYRVRFMPGRQGVWKYETRSNRVELAGRSGALECVAPGSNNHGPVRVRNTYHFAYTDGTPYRPIGTTSYSWVHRPDSNQEQTLAALSTGPFNKLRMCLFPTAFKSGGIEPALFPFESLDASFPRRWDFTRFDAKFFQHFERSVAQLRDMGIEVDLILYHPYDRGDMGFDHMEADVDDRYLRYVIARLAAYRNVWWSVANEFDLMEFKRDADWDRYFHIVQSEDPYGHLRSIHHSRRMYDVGKPSVTHLSVQNGIVVADFGRAVLYRQLCPKPVVFDEVKYEGNSLKRWGQLTGEEMVMRFWLGTIAGTYVGHGEALTSAEQGAWLSWGGKFQGQSPPRLAFLREVLASAPADGVEPVDQYYETRIGGKPGEYYLIYFGRETPTEWRFELPREVLYKDTLADGLSFRVEILDTWNMTITPDPNLFTIARYSEYAYRDVAGQTVPLPGRPYMALRVRRV